MVIEALQGVVGKLSVERMVNSLQHSFQLGCECKLKAHCEVKEVGHCLPAHAANGERLLVHDDELFGVAVLRTVGMRLFVAVQASLASFGRSKLIVQ